MVRIGPPKKPPEGKVTSTGARRLKPRPQSGPRSYSHYECRQDDPHLIAPTLLDHSQVIPRNHRDEPFRGAEQLHMERSARYTGYYGSRRRTHAPQDNYKTPVPSQARKGPVIYYTLQPSDHDTGWEPQHYNAFQLYDDRVLKAVTLRDIRESFPLPGTFHFRFKHAELLQRPRAFIPPHWKAEEKYYWLDIIDDNSFVPSYRGKILCHALRMAPGQTVNEPHSAYAPTPIDWPLQKWESPLAALGLRSYAHESVEYARSKELTSLIHSELGIVADKGVDGLYRPTATGQTEQSMELTRKIKQELLEKEGATEDKLNSHASKLTVGQLSKLKRTFKKYDENGSGFMDSRELESMMYDMGMPTSRAKVDEALRLMDIDGNRRVEYAEFVNWWAREQFGSATELATADVVRHLTADEKIELKRVFSRYDRDRKGYIQRHELSYLIEDMGMKPTEATLESAMRVMDADRNGRVEYDEFVQWWAQEKHGRADRPASHTRPGMGVDSHQGVHGQVDFKHVFQKYDLTSTGKITMTDMRAVLEDLGVHRDDVAHVKEQAREEMRIGRAYHVSYADFSQWWRGYKQDESLTRPPSAGRDTISVGDTGRDPMSARPRDSHVSPRPAVSTSPRKVGFSSSTKPAYETATRPSAAPARSPVGASVGEVEKETIKAAFKGLDLDRSGTIPAKDLGTLFTNMGQRKTPTFVARARRDLDKNLTGKVSYKDFLAWWATENGNR